MGHTKEKRSKVMKCTIKGCTGEYEKQAVNQSLKRQGRLVVVDGIPAMVCDVCGDTIFSADTTTRIEAILKNAVPPTEHAPLYRLG